MTTMPKSLEPDGDLQRFSATESEEVSEVEERSRPAIHRTKDALADGLRILEQIRDRAKGVRDEAFREVESAGFHQPLPAEAKALADYQHRLAVRAIQPDPDRERALVCALCSAIAQDRNLTLESVGGPRFRVVDTSVQRRLDEADRDLAEAGKALAEYRRDHREAFDARDRDAKRQAIHDALDSGDRERIVDVLGLRPAKPFTTRNLGGHGEVATRPAVPRAGRAPDGHRRGF